MSLGRNTLGNVSQAIGKVLNICASDDRVAEYVNRATQRLLPLGHWAGTMAWYRVCVNSACLTWPREVETIEHYWVNGVPGISRDAWYEGVRNGPGKVRNNSFCGGTLVDRGEVCAFDDVRGTNQRLALYCDNPADAGQSVLLNYYDSNGQKVIGNGEMGDRITLVAPPAYAFASRNVMANGLYGVQKGVTLGVVRLYSFDMVAATQYPLGYYEPSEILPTYRRSLVPGLQTMQGCGCPAGVTPCQAPTVEIYAKVRFIPVKAQSDWLLIGNQPALELAVQAVKLSEDGYYDKSDAALARAVGFLNAELQSDTGDATVPVMRGEGPDTWGAGVINWN